MIIMKVQPRYTVVRTLLWSREIIAIDNRTKMPVLFTFSEWEAKKGIAMLLINDQIVP